MTPLRWMAFAVALLPASCAFEFGEPPSAPNACESDDDCFDNETCSPLTGACALQMPDAVPERLRGSFRCVPGSPQWGGAALITEWSEFESRGYRVPADRAALTHKCGGGDGLDAEGRWWLFLDGARRYNPVLGALAFYRATLKLPKRLVVDGYEGEDAAISGELWLCPAEPPELAWSRFALDPCVLLFLIDGARLTVLRGDLSSGGVGLVVGMVDAPLTAHVEPPTGGE